MKAVIPAAGLGTRFLPATKCVPKELLPVLDKPVIQYVVEEALAPEGVDGVVIVTSHDKPQIESHFEPNPEFENLLISRGKAECADSIREVGELPVSFVYQEEPLGLGHAVHCAADEVGDEPFFVLLGDYFVPDHMMNKRMAEVSAAHGGASVIAVARVEPEDVSRYGIIAGDCIGCLPGTDAEGEEPGAVWKVTDLVEKPAPEDAPSHLYIVGRYLLTPRLMELLADQTPGAGGEIQLTDSLKRLLSEEEMYALVVDVREGYDTGTPAAWAASNARMALKGDMADAFREALVDVTV
jgi:UTP--glucose-1-phosphate uridylyltransferase